MVRGTLVGIIATGLIIANDDRGLLGTITRFGGECIRNATTGIVGRGLLIIFLVGAMDRDYNDQLIGGSLGLGAYGFAYILNYLALYVNRMDQGNGGDFTCTLARVTFNVYLWFLRGGYEGFLENMVFTIGDGNF